jgi:hypothetical protein
MVDTVALLYGQPRPVLPQHGQALSSGIAT